MEHDGAARPRSGARASGRLTGERLVKSKQRVADHGEVFTPRHLVDDMIDLVKGEAARIDSRFLEPACGSGNFLVPILERKLATAKARYGKSEFEYQHYALLALMSVYGIEILADNLAECRANLLEVFANHLAIDDASPWYWAATQVLTTNIIHGDALKMETMTKPPKPITFAEWTYLGKGEYNRRDFKMAELSTASSFGEDTLFADVSKHDLFKPVKDHGQLTVEQIADRAAR